MNKTIFRFIGLLVFLAFSAGVTSFWFYNIGELNCKLNAIVHLSDKKGLKTVTVPGKEFAAYPDKSEIKIDGSLYDVCNYKISGDSVVVTVWHDEQEETIQKQLVTLFENQQQQVGSPAGSSHLTKYHPYVPDFKVLHQRPDHQLALIEANVVTKFPSSGSFKLFATPLAGVVKPPPDLIA